MTAKILHFPAPPTPADELREQLQLLADFVEPYETYVCPMCGANLDYEIDDCGCAADLMRDD